MSDRIRILSIVRGTTVDGPGLRTSIYFAGCRHQCPGCHNPESWSFDGGNEMTLDELKSIIAEEDFNVTLSGGDPFYHPEAVEKICAYTKELNHSVWVYTGFTWEEILSEENLRNCLGNIDVLVEGRYIEALRDPDLRFRGSSNQRIIDVRKSLAAGSPEEALN